MTHISNLDTLLVSENINGSIIEIDNFVCDLCVYGDELENLTEPQKQFYFIQNLEREVNNGGFEQYFSNSSGDNAHETILALLAIGALKTVDILQQAINEFPDQKVPVDRDKRQEMMEEMENAEAVWDLLDQRFFKYDDDLNTLNIRYIKRNKNLF